MHGPLRQAPPPHDTQEESSTHIPILLRQARTLGLRLAESSTIHLPAECTFRGETQILMNTMFAIVRLDSEMLYVVFAESTATGGVMGTTSQQALGLPAVMSRLQTMDPASMGEDLTHLKRELQEHCMKEVQYWQAPRLQRRLHDLQTQRYQTYMTLSHMSRSDPGLLVFVKVPCHLGQSQHFETAVPGVLQAPYMTPNMDQLFMWYEYSENWECHGKSSPLVKLEDMLKSSVCPRRFCIIPEEGLVPTYRCEGSASR